ncbi:MAG: tRNA (adenosine(37)-N6)-threonylcarbamoyltransferase complex ATPase subunit type 1 TsaE [Burkholderiaceae bacterium]
MVWSVEADCAASARALAGHGALQGAVVELCGPLGAGKTTFVRHLLRALGVTGRVKSPSYAVVEHYEYPEAAIARQPPAAELAQASASLALPGAVPALSCWHFDFYRFKDSREFEDAGLRDLYAAPGLKLAEWPENAQGALPMADLRIAIEPVDDGAGEVRRVRFSAFTPRGMELLR